MFFFCFVLFKSQGKWRTQLIVIFLSWIKTEFQLETSRVPGGAARVCFGARDTSQLVFTRVGCMYLPNM